jgi:hypothetical protein
MKHGALIRVSLAGLCCEGRRAGPDARVSIKTTGAFEYSARQSQAQFTLIVAPLLRE